jgi:hypothetical protein
LALIASAHVRQPTILLAEENVTPGKQEKQAIANPNPVPLRQVL